MKLVLFPSGERHFFSYTETDTEVSLILDESHVAGFPSGSLNVCNVIWRAVQIEPGESGLGTEDVVSQVSRPLADINVSIMQISTYDADFTLMPECDLKRALECLSGIFSISNNPFEDLGLLPSDLKSWESLYPMSSTEVNSLQDALLLDQSARERQTSLGGDSGIASGTPSRPNSDALDDHDRLGSSSMSSLSLLDAEKSPGTPKRTRHPFKTNYPHKLHITSMEENSMSVLAIRTDRFFSFTQTDTTLSIIMDDSTLALFPDHTLNTQAGDWRLIAIGDGPLGFDECGIVSEFSRPLNESGIGLFYLSTFSSDYIMVNDQDFELAVSRLHETAKSSADDIQRQHQESKDGGARSRHALDSDSNSDSDADSEIVSYSGSESETASDIESDDNDADAKEDEEVEVVFEG
ncbi:GATS protein-like 3 [Dissophora globulifera]|nr:GATS protein-like 3 [Dissophora globulifera]